MEDRDINKILGNGAADCIELANAAFEEIMRLEDEPTINGFVAKRAIQIAGNARRAITDKLVEIHRAIKPQEDFESALAETTERHGEALRKLADQ